MINIDWHSNETKKYEVTFKEVKHCNNKIVLLKTETTLYAIRNQR